MAIRIAKYLFVVIGVLGALVLGLWIAGVFGYRINEISFQQIKVGMTMGEVQGLLGGPPNPADGKLGFTTIGPSKVRTEMWNGRDCAIIINFRNGRVTESSFVRYSDLRHPPSESDNAFEDFWKSLTSKFN